MTHITRPGIDLAKHVFQLHGVDERGHTVLRRRISRTQLRPFFAPLRPCLVGIVACGVSSAGYSLYVKNGKLHYDFNCFGKETYHVESSVALPEGEVEVAMRYEQLPFKQLAEATGGPAELFINGKSVGKGEIKNVAPGRFFATETMDIGMDLGASVTAAYRGKAPFTFTGTINDVTVEVSPTQPLKH